MGVAFARESFEQAWPGIARLVQAHWQEVAYPGDTPPSPDVAAYAAACREGRLATFTVREFDTDRAVVPDSAELPKLLGYATFWVGPFPQRQGILGAWQDAIYVATDARQGNVGRDFLAYCDAMLESHGCRVVHHSVRDSCDFSGVLRRLGYVRAETVYAKHLGA